MNTAVIAFTEFAEEASGFSVLAIRNDNRVNINLASQELTHGIDCDTLVLW